MEKQSVSNDIKECTSGQANGLNPTEGQLGISNSRRRFSRLSLGAAPIVISLVSKPVWGDQCLSNMMSGNLSAPNRGNCSKGWSPGGWGQPGGMISTYSTIGAWTKAGYDYGNYQQICGNESKAECYTGGSEVRRLPTGLLTSSSSIPLRPLREVVNDSQNNRDRLVLTAWLNANLSEKSGGTFKYILTTTQVIGLAKGSLALPPPYLDLNSFLSSTWN